MFVMLKGKGGKCKNIYNRSKLKNIPPKLVVVSQKYN